MFQIVLVVHLIITCALVGIILVQRSEGGGLGSVSGGGNIGAIAPRSQADGITRITGFLAAAFMITSLSLVLIATHSNGNSDLVQQLQSQATPGQTNPLAPNSPSNAPVGSSTLTKDATPAPAEPSVPLAK